MSEGIGSRRGRPVEHRLAEDIAILSLLSQAGSSTSPRELAALLGCDETRAADALRSLSTEVVVPTSADEVLGPLLPLCSDGAGGRVRRLDVATTRMRPLRLTGRQAQACSAALDHAGIPATDPLRRRVEAAFWPNGGPTSTDVPNPAGQGDAHKGAPADPHAADEPRDPDAPPREALEACARALLGQRRTGDGGALVEGHPLTFGYRGANDQITRSRRAVPLRIRIDEEWLVDCFDLDARATRTFRLALMEGPRIEPGRARVPVSGAERPDGGCVTLTCRGGATNEVLAWEGARVIAQTGDTTTIEVPYYRGDWLPRHVISLGDQVTHDSPRLAEEMRDIAREDLGRARRRLRERG